MNKRELDSLKRRADDALRRHRPRSTSRADDRLERGLEAVERRSGTRAALSLCADVARVLRGQDGVAEARVLATPELADLLGAIRLEHVLAGALRRVSDGELALVSALSQRPPEARERAAGRLLRESPVLAELFEVTREDRGKS